MTSLVGGLLGCFARGQERVSLQDPRASILRLSMALWKGPCTTWLQARLCLVLPAVAAVAIGGCQSLLHGQLIQSCG